MKRGLRVAVVLLIIGIGLGWYGLDQATATTVECGGHLMSPGDQCNHFGISNGNAYGDTGSYQDASGCAVKSARRECASRSAFRPRAAVTASRVKSGANCARNAVSANLASS